MNKHTLEITISQHRNPGTITVNRYALAEFLMCHDRSGFQSNGLGICWRGDELLTLDEATRLAERERCCSDG